MSRSKVIAEYDNGAAVTSPSREYIYAGSQLVAKNEAGATNYFHPDHLSTRANTDSGGNVSRTFGQYPFGEVWYETGTANKFKFTTYERDAESGNDYAMARSYINRYGRFSSTDPLSSSIADPQTLDRYAYSRNDPINLADPSGMLTTPHPPEPNPSGPEGPWMPPSALGPCTFGINSSPWIEEQLGLGGGAWACNDPNEGPGGRFGNGGGGGSGSSPLRDLLRDNKDCAAILGGTDKALELLKAANRIATDKPWTPPATFLGPDSQAAVNLVSQNTPGVFATVDFGSSGFFNAWDGKSFNVYTNANYAALSLSQRLTVFIHELHHVSLGNTVDSKSLDMFGMGSMADFLNIADKCKTAVPK